MAVNEVLFGGQVVMSTRNSNVNENNMLQGARALGANGQMVYGLVPPMTVDSQLDAQSSNPVANSVVTAALNGKQNALTIDPAPTQNSANPVSSGGVYTALIPADNTDCDDLFIGFLT